MSVLEMTLLAAFVLNAKMSNCILRNGDVLSRRASERLQNVERRHLMLSDVCVCVRWACMCVCVNVEEGLLVG